MEQVKIKIHRLGRIGESEAITLNRFMLFSGESGLGKSYLSILCNYIFYILSNSGKNSRLENFILDVSDGAKDSETIIITKLQLESWLSRDAVNWVGYMTRNDNIVGDIEIILPPTISNKIEIKKKRNAVITSPVGGKQNRFAAYTINKTEEYLFSEAFIGAINQENPMTIMLRDYLAKIILGKRNPHMETYVFPPSRGAMFTERVEPLTGLYECFDKNIPELLRARQYKVEQSEINGKLLKGLLDGEVRYENNQYLYTADNGEVLPLSAAAASVRELTPFAFLLKNVPLNRVALMIDEPEAHLHPSKQRMMADLLSSICNGGAYLQVTTHSDYLIRRINELVMKEQIFLITKGGAKYTEICKELNTPEQLKLDPNMVSAFLLTKNGDVSVVEKQDLSQGVPFSSFLNAIKESLTMQDKLSDVLSMLKGEESYDAVD